MGARHGTLEERFWRWVKKTDSCWLWTGATTNCGYGVINDGTRKLVRTSRLSYSLANGPIPDGKLVLHRCDTPACVNPAHLFIGTHADNTRDMYSKGRGVPPPLHCGVNQHLAKLTANKVRQIREMKLAGHTGVKLARQFGVSTTVISLVSRRQSWAHVS